MYRYIAWIQNNIISKIRNDKVGAFAGQSSYFLILSFLPFMMFLLLLFQYLPLDFDSILEPLYVIVPEHFRETFRLFLEDLHVNTNVTFFFFSIILTIWTAGKGIMAITGGLNEIYEVKEERNYVFLRLKASLYTLLFAALILFTIAVMVFGDSIYAWIRENSTTLMPENSKLLDVAKSFGAVIFYFFIFTFFYVFLPAKKQNVIKQMPGAGFTTIGWLVMSAIFNFYVEISGSNSFMYGSMAYLIIILIYLYFLMFVFFLGAELNVFLFSLNKHDDDYHLMY